MLIIQWAIRNVKPTIRLYNNLLWEFGCVSIYFDSRIGRFFLFVDGMNNGRESFSADEVYGAAWMDYYDTEGV